MNQPHPLLKYAQDTAQNFDFKKFRDQVVMGIAVAIVVHYAKSFWVNFTDKRKG